MMIMKIYQTRSDDLEDMCLADFATKYTAANDFSQGTSISLEKQFREDEIVKERCSFENS